MAINYSHGSDYHPPPRTVSDDVNDAINKALLKRHQRKPKRHYLGASIMGHECARRLCYEYAQTERDEPLTAKTIRIFDTGHMLEDTAIGVFDEDALSATFKGAAERWLGEAGFELKTRDSRGEQFGFSALDGRIQGHIDAAITAVPASLASKFPAMPIGWEHKGLNAKSWNKVKKHGVKIANPIYFGQMQIYMGYLQLWAFLFTATNKNTSEMHHEIVEYDASCAQRLSDRGLSVVTAVDAGHLLPRPYNNRDYYICKMCPFAIRCWTVDSDA